MARIRTRQLAQLCRRVSIALHAGLDARSVWSRETERGPAAQRTAIRHISDQVAVGGAVADAMRELHGFFPAMTCEMVDVGEKSGSLDAVLLQLADHYDHLVELRQSFLRRIAWPVFQLCIGILIVGLLILILGMVGSGADVLGLGLSTGASFTIYCTLVVLFFGLLALVIVAVQRGWLGSWPRQVALRIPVLGRVLHFASTSNFAWSLSLSLGAGMDVRPAVRLSLAASQDPLFLRHESQIDSELETRQELALTLRQTGEFEDEFLELVETGELTGQLPESLERAANMYRERGQAASKALVFAVSVAIWFAIAGLLIFVIMRLYFVFYLQPIRDALKP